MYSYFVARGHRLNYLINLSYSEKVFFLQTMEREIEIEAKKWGVENINIK